MKPSCYFEVLPDMVKNIAQRYQRTEKSLSEDVDTLRTWMKNQPHFPEVLSKKMLQNCLILCKCSVEKAKQSIDNYYTIRPQLPELLDVCHPQFAKTEKILDIIYWLPLPKLTHEMYRVFIFKINNKERLNELDPNDIFRFGFNLQEMRFFEDVMHGDVFIVDLEGIDFRFVTKFTPLFVAKVFATYEKLCSSPMKGVYFINSPSYVNVLTALLKQAIKPKLFQRVHVCQDTSVLAHNFSLQILPRDYGGHERSFEELRKMMEAKLDEYEDRFLKLEKLRIDESLRPEELKNDDILGFYGNFKQLDLD